MKKKTSTPRKKAAPAASQSVTPADVQSAPAAAPTKSQPGASHSEVQESKPQPMVQEMGVPNGR
jgi:hypothetical protein